jgi:GTP pyrophosphokinase
MSKLKNELEELAFRHLEPASYQSLRQQVDGKRRATEGLIDELRKRLAAKLDEAQVPVVSIDGRIKRLWSIHQKLERQKVSLDQVYDFLALRVITRSVKDCYAVLGIIHQMWQPVPGRFKDFIAMPRPNGYRSLHTSVVGERGVPFEVRSAPRRCTRSPRRASPRTGNTRKGGSGPTGTSSTSSGCGS